jgi:hypothetical protein
LRKYLTQSYCPVKVLEDVSRGNAQVASGCSREEEAAAEEVEVVEEEVEVVVVEMVVEMVAAETTGVETMVVMTEGVMKGVGMMVVKEGKTVGYDKKRGKIRENRKSKGRNLNKRIHQEMRKNIPLPQNLKHNSHSASKNNPFLAEFI